MRRRARDPPQSRESDNGPKFEVFGTSNPELRTMDRTVLSILPSHAPRCVGPADFFSILREDDTLAMPPPSLRRSLSEF
jgi:hypothetical protein